MGQPLRLLIDFILNIFPQPTYRQAGSTGQAIFQKKAVPHDCGMIFY
jgi:hypothetical protein